MNAKALKITIKSLLDLKRKSVKTKFADNLVEYVRVSKLSFEEQCSYFGLVDFKYYKGATVNFTEAVKSGRFFNCTNHTIENALIEIVNNTVYIRSYDLTAINSNVIVKKLYGKYFSFSNGTKITVNTFKKHLKILESAINNNKVEFDEIRERENAEREMLEKEKQDEREMLEKEKQEIFEKEFSEIKVDEIWLKEKEQILKLCGLEKNDAFIIAFKGLLQRNNIEKVNNFYKLMKCL